MDGVVRCGRPTANGERLILRGDTSELLRLSLTSVAAIGGGELQADEGELGWVGDGVQVVDDPVTRLELQDADELAVLERQHTWIPIDRLGDERSAAGGTPELEQVAADHQVTVQRSARSGADAEVDIADSVGIEQFEQGTEIAAGAGGDEPLGDAV